MEITSTEFKQNQGRYFREATREPVKVTLYGRTTHVILSIEDYEQLLKESKPSKLKE